MLFKNRTMSVLPGLSSKRWTATSSVREANAPPSTRAYGSLAKEMAARWQERVEAAERVRFESTFLGRLLSPFGISYLRVTKQGLLFFAWAMVPGRLKLVAGGLVAIWLVLALTVGGAILFALSSAL